MIKIRSFITNDVILEVDEAYLWGADLRWADLRWADLREADLRWANLRWADLRYADLLLFHAGEYTAIVGSVSTSIGCEVHSSNDWLKWKPDDVVHMANDAAEWWTNYGDIIKGMITKLQTEFSYDESEVSA